MILKLFKKMKFNPIKIMLFIKEETYQTIVAE